MNLEQKVVEILGQLQGLAKPAANVAIQVVHVDAIVNLVGGVVALAIAMASVIGLRRVLAKHCAKYESDDWMDCPHIIIPFGLGILIFGLGGIISMFDIWSWIGVFNPELALAHTILEKVGK